MKYLLLILISFNCYALPKDIRKFEDGDNVCYTYGEFSGISCVKKSKPKKTGKFQVDLDRIFRHCIRRVKGSHGRSGCLRFYELVFEARKNEKK